MNTVQTTQKTAKKNAKKTIGTLTEMTFFTAVLAGLMILFFVLYHIFHTGWMQSVAITLLTVFYHFAMRLVVGETVTLACREKEFPQDRLGFRLHGFEPKLYKLLQVKNWKTKTITARPEQFDLKQVSPEELLHNVMQAELVHRIIMVLSFVPLLFILPFGTPVVFVITSIIACLIDSVFVIIQRYNRPRVIRYKQLMEKKQSHTR